MRSDQRAARGQGREEGCVSGASMAVNNARNRHSRPIPDTLLSFHSPTPLSPSQVVSPTIIKAPLWDAAALGAAAYPSNEAFVREHVINLLATSFPNLTQQQVRWGP